MKPGLKSIVTTRIQYTALRGGARAALPAAAAQRRGRVWLLRRKASLRFGRGQAHLFEFTTGFDARCIHSFDEMLQRRTGARRHALRAQRMAGLGVSPWCVPGPLPAIMVLLEL